MPEPDYIAEGDPRLAEFSAKLDELLAFVKHDAIHGYHPDHPPVICGGCNEEFTSCKLGNYYCPSCQTDITESECAHCGDDPCHFCGQAKEVT